MLVTGAAGLLGTWLRRRAPADRPVIALGHRRTVAAEGALQADLRDAAATAEVFARVRPDTVIHAAYALEETSIVTATRHVAAAAAAHHSAVVFVSTDAVFAGDPAPRDEQAPPDPIADYGRWKAAAEAIVADLVPDAGIVRLPLLVSSDPPDPVVARIVSGARSGVPTRWFHDELRQPAMADEVAAALWRIVDLEPARRAGVWHLPGAELLSRHEIAQRVVAAHGLDPASVVAEGTPEGTARPRVLHLRGERAARTIGWAPAPVLAPPRAS